MSWGVATALLEQSGDEGLFEVDEAWLPRIAAELDPRLIVLGNLFRDQLDRYGELERLADEWARWSPSATGRSGFVAQRRRPAGRRPRPRPRAAPPPGRHLLRDRGPIAGAAGAPARPRRQALPALRRTPTPTRGRSSATSATTSARTAAPTGPPPTSPRPRSSCAGCAARASAIATPAGRGRARPAAPRPLQRLQRARGARRRAAARGRRSSQPSAALARVEAVFGRVETIEVGGTSGLDPADQEPRRRQRGPAHAAPRGRTGAAPGLDLWIALNDRIADGRDVSWIWDADFELLAGAVRRVVCSGTRAPEMAVRLKYAGVDPALIEVEPSIERLARPRRRGRRDRALRAPDLHGADRAPHAARLAGARRGVLAMSSGSRRTARRAPIWHDVECGAYAADLPPVARARDGGRRPGARARLGDRAGRARTSPAPVST